MLNFINVTWNKYGVCTLTTIYNDEYYWHQYMFYTEDEAKELFKQYVLEQDKQRRIFYEMP